MGCNPLDSFSYAKKRHRQGQLISGLAYPPYIQGFAKECGNAIEMSLVIIDSCPDYRSLPFPAEAGARQTHRRAPSRSGSDKRRSGCAANRVEPRRRGHLSGGILAFDETDLFREQRRGARVGWRPGALQEELS